MMMPSVFHDDFDLIDDFMKTFPFWDDRDMKKMERKLHGRRGRNLMKTDVRELKDGYQLEMDLPGFSRDDVKITLENGYLTVEAVRNEDRDKKERKNGRYIRKERYAGACRRSFYVGDSVKQEDVKASFHHGVLKLMIPKKESTPVEEKKDSFITIEG